MIKQPNEQHIAFMNALKSTLGGAGKDMPSLEILAVTAQFVGNLIAVQDCRKYTPDQLMTLVANNIEIGNQIAIDSMCAGSA